MSWQSIKTAPRDGTRILLWLPDSAHANVVFGWQYPEDEGEWMWEVGDGAFPIDVEVTHWMHVPDGPDDDSEALRRELGR